MTQGNSLDIQGHRGARGLFPENTIPAFIHALELGVTTLELDVVISRDNIPIISHEPFMSHEICKMPDGTDIKKSDAHAQNIYTLDYSEIKSYDCGSKYFGKFPRQEKLTVYKPSLRDMVTEVEKLSNIHYYNIEIKRKPEWDNKMHPGYSEFADLVVNEIKDLGILDRTTVQCFDVETLQYLNQKFPEVQLVYLIQNFNTPALNLEILGFTPAIYSPYYKFVNAELVEFCKVHQMKLIPWTVNTEDEMLQLIDLGVDGIITDYPDVLLNLNKQ